MKPLAAIIIEDRPKEDFGLICSQHLQYLPKDIDLFIHTSEETKPVFEKQLKSTGINYRFKSLQKDYPVPLEIRYISGLDQLLKDSRMKSLFNMCMLMTSSEFWAQYFDYERVLVFQTDSMIMRPGIEEFFEWDYVGAPCYNFVKDQTIQNGGLSLRNPRVMEYISRFYSWKTDLQDLMVVGQYSTASFFAEDIFFCLRMIKYNAGKLAPLDVAKSFSVESRFELGTLGYHRIEPYMSENEAKKIKKQYE